MNQRGRDALRQAALDGVRQITGAFRDGDGRCAVAVLRDAAPADSGMAYYGLNHMTRCPLCPAGWFGEAVLLAHLNDYHDLDFLGLAEKMPVTDGPS